MAMRICGVPENAAYGADAVGQSSGAVIARSNRRRGQARIVSRGGAGKSRAAVISVSAKPERRRDAAMTREARYGVGKPLPRRGRRLKGLRDSQYCAPIPESPVDFHFPDGGLPSFVPAHQGQCIPDNCWSYKDHIALLDGWALGQTLPQRLCSTLYQMIEKYAGFAHRHGQFYISWQFISDVVRVSRRTFQNYVSQLVQLGYLRVVSRSFNQWDNTYYDFVHCCGAQQLPLGTYIPPETLYAKRAQLSPPLPHGAQGVLWSEHGGEWGMHGVLRYEDDSESGANEDARLNDGEARGDGGASVDIEKRAWEDGYAAGLRAAQEAADANSAAAVRVDVAPSGALTAVAEPDAAAVIPAESGAAGLVDEGFIERAPAAVGIVFAEDDGALLVGDEPLAPGRLGFEDEDANLGPFGAALAREAIDDRIAGVFGLVSAGDLGERERKMARDIDERRQAAYGAIRAPDEFLVYALLEAREGRSFRGLFFGVLRRVFETNAAIFRGSDADALMSFTRDLARERDLGAALRLFQRGLPDDEAEEGESWL